MSTQPAAARLAPEARVAPRRTHEPTLVAVPAPEARLAAPLVPLRFGDRATDTAGSPDAVRRRLLLASDTVAIALVLAAVLSRLSLWGYAVPASLTVPLVLVAFHFSGLYARDELRLGHTTLDEAPLLACVVGLLTLCATMVLPRGSHAELAGAEIAVLWSVSFGAVFCARGLARVLARRLAPVERCLVIGEVTDAERILHKLATSAARAEVVCCIPEAAAAALHHPAAIRSIADEVGAQRLIIAGSTAGADGAELVRAAKAAGVHVTLLPQMFDVIGSAVSLHDLEGMTMLGVSRFGLPRSSRCLKRAFDLAGSGVILLLASPVLAAIALTIRIDSPGPILFRQARVGRDGRTFSIVKFRSMVADADRQKDALKQRGGASAGLFKLRDDPRITRVGKFLRKSSLDELPQLLNVLGGEMSLVGPRPLILEEDRQIQGLYRQRLHLTPGMTGPWQLLRSRVPLHEMVEIDYLYVAGWSLWQDVKILLRTAGHVLRRGNI